MGEQDRNDEQSSLDRQEKKLVGFYLSGGDERYIFSPNEAQFSEEHITPSDEEGALSMMRDGKDFSGIEWKLLMRIAGPDYFKGNDGVFNEIAEDKHQKRILGHMTGMRWDMHDYTSEKNVAEFLRRFPTPMDFDQVSADFLQMIYDQNGEQKLQEYEEAMENFQMGVYGKKYEYYKAMKELHKKAAESTTEQFDGQTQQEIDNNSMLDFSEIFNKDRSVIDSGLAMLNKGVLTGNPNRPNEDAVYYNPAIGVFGVFDGAGGMGGATRASELGVAAVGYSVNQEMPKTPGDLAKILETASETVKHDPGAGYSTAVLGKIVETQGRKALIWASVGDSRIYVVKNGEAVLLTRDEGGGHQITNALGVEYCDVKHKDEYPLNTGDRIVFCSDGVTGDYEPDFIPSEEFADIVGGAETADMAAWNLVNRATKKDDRTAIVVEV